MHGPRMQGLRAGKAGRTRPDRLSAPQRARRSGAARSPRLAQADPGLIGSKLRDERERQGIALREFARRVGVSPSLVSQIERGMVMPSVGSLWSMATELGLVIDDLFKGPGQRSARGRGAAATTGYVQRKHNRKRIRLAGGVEWERLTPLPDEAVEFLYVKYAAGAESCPEHAPFRHDGKEYAYILSGRLGLQIGAEKYELNPGDSVSFDSQVPHRLWAIGNEAAVAIWTIINRNI